MLEVYSVLWDGGKPFVKSYLGVSEQDGRAFHALNPGLEMASASDDAGLAQVATWIESPGVSKIMHDSRLKGFSDKAREALSKDAAKALSGTCELPPKATKPLMAVKMSKDSEIHQLFGHMLRDAK